MLRAKLTADDDAVFQSAKDAVRFALSFPNRPPRPAMNRLLNWLASRRKLSVLDPAVQAGMIRSILEQGGQFAMAILTATIARPCNCRRAKCHGKLNGIEWLVAIEIIAEEAFAKDISSAPICLRMACVSKVFGENLSQKQIAEDLCIDEDTVATHFKAIQRWLRGDRSRQQQSLQIGVEQEVWRQTEKALRAVWLIQ